jgi:hypothetical protein
MKLEASTAALSPAVAVALPPSTLENQSKNLCLRKSSIWRPSGPSLPQKPWEKVVCEALRPGSDRLRPQFTSSLCRPTALGMRLLLILDVYPALGTYLVSKASATILVSVGCRSQCGQHHAYHGATFSRFPPQTNTPKSAISGSGGRAF